MRDTLRARADALRSLGPRGMIPCAIWPRPRASAPHGRSTKRGLTPTRCSRLATWSACRCECPMRPWWRAHARARSHRRGRSGRGPLWM